MPGSASSQELTRLKAVLDGALAGLENVSPKRLFGCDAWFAQGNIFALVWKEGRLGLRLSDSALQAQALAEPGAEPWLQEGKAVKHWVLLPQAWNSQPALLRSWGRRAYGLAIARPEKFKVTGQAQARVVKLAVFKKVSKSSRG